MSLFLLEGFETGYLTSRWTSASGSLSTANPRTGVYHWSGGAATNTSLRLRWPGPTVAQTDEWIVGFAWYPVANASGHLCHFLSDNNTRRRINIAISGPGRTISVYADSTTNTANDAFTGTLLGTSAPNVWQPNAWHYVEIRAVLSDTVGEYQIRINNTTIMSATGIDTYAGTAIGNVFSGFTLWSPDGFTCYYDDIYMVNTDGSAPHNTFLGDLSIAPQLPDGNGNYSQFVGSDANSVDNYLLVDEAGAPVTADYVQSTITGDRDSYTFSNLGVSNSANILGVMTSIHAQKSDSGARSIRMFHRDAGIDTNDATNQILGTSWQTYDWLNTINPQTGLAWTTTDVDNAEWGVEARP